MKTTSCTPSWFVGHWREWHRGPRRARDSRSTLMTRDPAYGGTHEDDTEARMKTTSCTDHTPSWFVGHWREWHRGHGCDQDDGKPRSDIAVTEVEQHTANKVTGFLTDAELGFLRAATTSGDTLRVRALDELAARRTADKLRTAAFDHSARIEKHFEPLMGFCICAHCTKLPERAAAAKELP